MQSYLEKALSQGDLPLNYWLHSMTNGQKIAAETLTRQEADQRNDQLWKNGHNYRWSLANPPT